MRILSQEGLHEGIIDVPYEQVSLEQKENEIWCGYSSTLDRHCLGKCFAKYSDERKARKAMEMLQDKYTGIADGYKDEDGVLYRARKSIDNFYFQFPIDDEVEV